MFELIDCSTGDIFGPYITESEARARANAFEVWQIVDGEGQLVCERWPPAHSDEAIIPH